MHYYDDSLNHFSNFSAASDMVDRIDLAKNYQ